MDIDIPDSIASLFTPYPVLEISLEIEGQRVRGRKILFGLRSGPVRVSLSALVHEVAHFIEIDEDRMTEDGWGLVAPEMWIPGHPHPICEPVTDRMLEREIRVVSIQSYLHEALGIGDDVLDTLEALRFIPTARHIPFDAEGFLEAVMPMYIEQRAQWDADRALSEWHRRAKIACSIMEGTE